MNDCLFCRIATGAISTKLIWSNEEFVAFRDIDPRAPVHVLVVPRRHLDSLAALAEEDPAYAGRFVRAAVAVAGREGLLDPERGFRFVANTGPEGGQSVAHLHAHILGGRALAWPPG
ncbi:MAG: histidine triad nucleotide-binding protein [Candidatus Eisenbacteria bacterium]